MIAPLPSPHGPASNAELAESRRRSARQITKLIMGGVALWGTVHAIGAYRYNKNPLRSLVVLACTFGFLGFWWLALWSLERRSGRSKP